MTQNFATPLTPEQTIGERANILQFNATHPQNSIWVNASAGSGKTKVLAERLLRLMLPQDGRPGTAPERILCITFTRAAAAEVLERIMRYLREWTIADESTLAAALTKILGTTPDAHQITSARALFARVLEAPGGMKIMTTHAFCQSVLGRFPMEAGLPAGFEVMDETAAAALMTRVRQSIVADLSTDPTLQNAFSYLASTQNADQLEALLKTLTSERTRLHTLLARFGDIDAIQRALDAALDIPAGQNAQSLMQAFMSAIPAAALRAALPDLSSCTTKGNKAHAANLDPILASPPSAEDYQTYIRIFLKRDDTPRLPTGIVKKTEHLTRLFADEAARAMAAQAQLRNIHTATATRALLRFGLSALARYEAQKRARGHLDYEDLITRTRALLSDGGIKWVLYKLDGGLDHILVDEAQDTNPDQWAIITALYDEFYDGQGARDDTPRTTFVVGDEKQSIYSFQRADPLVFEAMRTRLSDQAGAMFQNIPMSISFRSSPAVLDMVDATFSAPDMHEGVSRSGPIGHQAFWSQKPGLIELWPLIEKAETPDPTPWAIHTPSDDTNNPVATLARHVAQKISALLNDPSEILESEDRRIQPGDCLILLKNRKPLADALLKALRREGVPVSGIDRMVVSAQLGVKDVLSVLQFILQPDDDLNLATLLKTPFIALDEDTLYAACHTRGPTTLWATIKANHPAIGAWLSDLLTLEHANISPLLHHILYQPCPANPHSGLQALASHLGADVRDPLQELLARADHFDAHDARTLQGFVQDMLADDTELKRQLEDGANTVRIMTVHASKGLQAPIVFMPDTVRAKNAGKDDPIYWPTPDDSCPMPLWVPSADLRADAITQRIKHKKTRHEEEYRRLLYVALTRAGERLYIGGANKYAKGRADLENSWYAHCARAFDSGLLAGATQNDDGIWAYAYNRPAAKTLPHAPKTQTSAPATLPIWATTLAPTPASPPRPLLPSAPEGDTPTPAALSPLLGTQDHRFRRGRLIHTLFQFLPDLPADTRYQKAQDWLQKTAPDLSERAHTEIMARLKDVLEDPSFATIFTPAARPEVPITGLASTTSVISGQIDRLLVSEDEILVVDYKTNRPAPKIIADVPEAYRRQMQLYRTLLSQIWPQKPIRCALLWTDGPQLMDITPLLES